MANFDLSVIVPVCTDDDQACALYPAYRDAVAQSGLRYQFIYLLCKASPTCFDALKQLKAQGEPITIIRFARNFGEATGIKAAFHYAEGDAILTLPPYEQVRTADIAKVLAALPDNDMVIARRWPRQDSWFNRLQSRLFHQLLRKLSGYEIDDTGCMVRAFKRRLLEEIEMYGEQHRYLPLLAYQHGFQVACVDVRQAKPRSKHRLYSPGNYLRRLLDLIAIVFLTKFNKKPLRFFGLIGAASFCSGVLGLLYLVAERFIWSVPMADRPIMLLFSILLVLGIQLAAIGLVGETIIFTHGKDIKEYAIKEIIN